MTARYCCLVYRSTKYVNADSKRGSEAPLLAGLARMGPARA